MADDEVSDASAAAKHQQFDSNWGRALIALAVLALVLVVVGIASMVWYMEKKRCRGEDCEKCAGGEEDFDEGTTEDEN